MIQIFRPNRDNLNTSLSIGIPIIALAFIDFFVNTFLNINLTGFLPNTLSYFFPLISAAVGLYFIRISYSGIRILAIFNMINYLNLIISISMFINWYNKKMAIKEK